MDVVAVAVVCVLVVAVVVVVGVSVCVVVGVEVGVAVAVVVAVDAGVIVAVVVAVLVGVVVGVAFNVVVVDLDVEVKVEVVGVVVVVVVTVSPHQTNTWDGSPDSPPNNAVNFEQRPSVSDGVPLVGSVVAPRSYERPRLVAVPQNLEAAARVFGSDFANLLSTTKQDFPRHFDLVHQESTDDCAGNQSAGYSLLHASDGAPSVSPGALQPAVIYVGVLLVVVGVYGIVVASSSSVVVTALVRVLVVAVEEGVHDPQSTGTLVVVVETVVRRSCVLDAAGFGVQIAFLVHCCQVESKKVKSNVLVDH